MQQKIFEALAKTFESKGYDTYYLDVAPENADCPYIQMTYSSSGRISTKKEAGGSVYVIVNIWHDRAAERDVVAQMINDIISIACGLQIEGYSLDLATASSRILYDTSTSTTYLHGVVDLTFNYM
jgi:hypothetical protein